jgi:hypothetical protein
MYCLDAKGILLDNEPGWKLMIESDGTKTVQIGKRINCTCADYKLSKTTEFCSHIVRSTYTQTNRLFSGIDDFSPIFLLFFFFFFPDQGLGVHEKITFGSWNGTASTC